MPWTAPTISRHKAGIDGNEPLVMVTAYDAPSATLVSEGGADLILVGDSLAMVVLGYDDTLQVTVDDMAYHTAAVRRAGPEPFVVADLPWMAYHSTPERTVDNAAVLMRAGAQAVKLEGGTKRIPMIEAILSAEIPVMGHIGLTPQSTHVMGGFRVQGREVDGATRLIEEAMLLAETGCFAVVLEGVPREVAARVTEAVPIPTIGIGAGPSCDGQVLVFHDVLGVQDHLVPRFVRTYADIKTVGVQAISAFAGDVRSRAFPNDEESYHLKAEVAGQFDDAVDELAGLYGSRSTT